MYSESDIDDAVTAGAITRDAATALRDHIARSQSAPAVDEEHFRLLTGFNDIFVSIAAAAVLVGMAWLGESVTLPLAGVLVAATSWGLAEYFTRQRRMALPSILLLCGFAGGMFTLGAALGGTALDALTGDPMAAELPWVHPLRNVGWVVAGAVTMGLATLAHWRRFHVPITVAAGAGAAVAAAIALVIAVAPGARAWWPPLLLAGGLSLFALALRWDMSDRARITRRADVAFWLHLSASPLIVHPTFALLGLLGTGSLGTGPGPWRAVAAVGLYGVLTLVGLVVDRRALLVSALFYVLYAISALLRSAGDLSVSLALTALVVGSALLLLSAFWHSARRVVLRWTPEGVRRRMPAA